MNQRPNFGCGILWILLMMSAAVLVVYAGYSVVKLVVESIIK